MQNTLPSDFSQVPRRVLAAPIWPFRIEHELSPEEIRTERFLYRLEVAATRPAPHPLALALAAVMSIPDREAVKWPSQSWPPFLMKTL